MTKLAWLKSWPDEEEAQEIAPILNSLSPLAAKGLGVYVRNLEEALARGRRPGLFWRTAGPKNRQRLLDAGLIEEEKRGDKSYGHLTPLGERVGRVLATHGDDPAPDYVQQLF